MIAVIALVAVLATPPAARAAPAGGADASPSRSPSPARPILDDATIAREYDDYRRSLAGMAWYRVRYIRVADEAAARSLIARIRSGGDFARFATEQSLHAESAARGGDLGEHASCRWARATIDMLERLAPGQLHPEPVKGTHGWGIYRLEAKRPLEPRSLAAYREALLGGTFEPECPWVPPVSVGATPAPSSGPAPRPPSGAPRAAPAKP